MLVTYYSKKKKKSSREKNRSLSRMKIFIYPQDQRNTNRAFSKQIELSFCFHFSQSGQDKNGFCW